MALRTDSYRDQFRLDEAQSLGGPKPAPRKAARAPFEVNLSPEELQGLGQELADDIEDAISARNAITGENTDLDKWHKIYEGGDKTLTRNYPWPGAANLTSYIGTEKVDALRARIMQTVFVDPLWIVEGWGPAATRAPFVERFHHWKAEEERLQGFMQRVIHNSLIEGTGVLEVAERAEWRRVRATIQGQLLTDPMGMPVMDPMGVPQFAKDESGVIVEAQGDGMASAEVEVERYVRVRRGPQYRVLSLRDFYILPGHAGDRSEVWGYAKRFYRTIGQLKESAGLGHYGNLEQLGDDSERGPTPSETRSGQAIAPQLADRVEKELWEVPFLRDLDGDGIQEWYLATVSRHKRILLRIQRDDLAPSRFLLFTPFPRPNSLYGYSFIGHKLDTIIAEHTAERNAIADRSSLVNNAPIVRVVGALWDPYEQPWGPGAVIDVRDPKEITAMQIPDVPGSLVQREQMTLAASERLSGLNDATLGVNPAADRTATEYTSVTTMSSIRIEEIIRNIQEAVEDLWLVRHEIWKRTLRDGSNEQLPESLIAIVSERGFRIPEGAATAELLEGPFRGKPHGSVETADLNKQRQDFIGFLQALAQLVQAVPGLQILLSQPTAFNAILKQAMRVFRWEDKQGLTGVADEQFAVGPMGMGTGMPMPPGMAPGMPQPGMGGMNPAGQPAGLPALLPALMAARGGPPA